MIKYYSAKLLVVVFLSIIPISPSLYLPYYLIVSCPSTRYPFSAMTFSSPGLVTATFVMDNQTIHFDFVACDPAGQSDAVAV